MNTVRRIKRGEGGLYKRLRLGALSDSPDCFATSYAEAICRADESWEKQANEAANGSDRAIFFAYSDAEPVGLVALYRDSHGPHIGELIQLWVSPLFRGRGVGLQLIEAAIAWARQQQFEMVRASVTKQNDGAFSFYDKCGFTQSFSVGDDLDQEFVMRL